MKPFLKWAGGKQWLTVKLRDRIPTFGRYFEPFLGGGSLYFSLEPKIAVLGDANGELINCYRQIRNRPRVVIAALHRLRFSAKNYYRARDRFQSERHAGKRAALFIFLNHTCWNGLYRENREGVFNVPMREASYSGRIFDAMQLVEAGKLLRRAKLLCADFEETTDGARAGDLVYLDPPYITTHLENGFIKYNAKLFTAADELRLARVAARLAQRGVHVIASNASHPAIRELYDGPFYKYEFSRTSRIAANVERRSGFKELLISTFALARSDGRFDNGTSRRE